MKGHLIGPHGLEDINISHFMHAALLQSDVSGILNQLVSLYF